jgi:hypothetical protein
MGQDLPALHSENGISISRSGATLFGFLRDLMLVTVSMFGAFLFFQVQVDPWSNHRGESRPEDRQIMEPKVRDAGTSNGSLEGLPEGRSP